MDLSDPSYSDNDPLLDQPTAPPEFGAEVAAVGLPPVGTLIGRYELKREIARGAMGVVYLAALAVSEPKPASTEAAKYAQKGNSTTCQTCIG